MAPRLASAARVMSRIETASNPLSANSRSATSSTRLRVVAETSISVFVTLVCSFMVIRTYESYSRMNSSQFLFWEFAALPLQFWEVDHATLTADEMPQTAQFCSFGTTD